MDAKTLKPGPFSWSTFWAFISAVAALLALWAMYKANQQGEQNAADNRYYVFRETLSQLSRIEASSLSHGDTQTGCSGDGCLGNLAFSDSYYTQYELLALRAASQAKEFEGRLNDFEALQLASALYTAGRLVLNQANLERHFFECT